MNGNAHKIEGVSASETSKFGCTVTEDAKVRTRKFREFLTLILWPFSKYYKFRGNIHSEDVKSKFHCICTTSSNFKTNYILPTVYYVL